MRIWDVDHLGRAMAKGQDWQELEKQVEVDWEGRFFRLEDAARSAMVFLQTMGKGGVAVSPTHCRSLASRLAQALEP